MPPRIRNCFLSHTLFEGITSVSKLIHYNVYPAFTVIVEPHESFDDFRVGLGGICLPASRSNCFCLLFLENVNTRLMLFVFWKTIPSGSWGDCTWSTLVKNTQHHHNAMVNSVNGPPIAARSHALSMITIWPASFFCTNCVEKKF